VPVPGRVPRAITSSGDAAASSKSVRHRRTAFRKT
jgi:hypothetical protein